MFRLTRLLPTPLLLWMLPASLPGAQTAEAPPPPALTEREKWLLARIEALEARIAALERPPAQHSSLPAAQPPQTTTAPVTAAVAAQPKQPLASVNLFFDGYYAWNANRPVGRVNLLRAYDVTANNLGINQSGLVLEHRPDPESGKRWGLRLDLMFGQATETLQGGAQNEPRPQVYRHLFQAYGTYVAPLGRRGLTLDFGKWASSLGAEGNYTKDQINYSRSYFFNFLPFYHTGLRASYPVHERLTLSYWLVNGANQSEDFNGAKSQLAQAVIRPARNVTWTTQYYGGREQRDLEPALNPGLPSIPTQPGLSVTPVAGGAWPRGRFHVLDTYAFWSPTAKLTLGGELDTVINRVASAGAPQRVTGGAAYLRYQLSRTTYFGQRYVRLRDRAGLFSGTAQTLQDFTSTLSIRPAEGFEARLEFRRDRSDRPFFLMSRPGALGRNQSTVTLGLMWWLGGKAGAW